VFGQLLGQDDPVRPSAPARVDGTDATASGAEAEHRFLPGLDLRDQVAGRGVPPGELDAGDLADEAAPAVATDQVPRSQRRAVGQLDVDAGAVLGEAHHVAAAEDGNPELVDPAGQDALEVALPERQEVVVTGGEVADVQEGPGVAHDAVHAVALRQEALGDTPLIEDLDGAGVQTPRSRPVEVLAGAPFDDDDVDRRQRQLDRQHHPGRAAPCDHHRTVGHHSGRIHAATPSLQRCRPSIGPAEQ
jgi:hypothetical protein